VLQTIAEFIERYQRWFGYPLILLMSTLAFSTAYFNPYFLEQIEMKTLDQRFKLRGPIAPDPRVVIVAVDDTSLSEVGRWPWSRDKIAQMIDLLINKYGVKTIGFDVVFSEKQLNPFLESVRLLDESGHGNDEVSRWLLKHSSAGDIDSILEKTLKKYHSRVIPGYFFYLEGGTIPAEALKRVGEVSRMMEPSSMSSALTEDAKLWLPHMAAVEPNLRQFTYATDAVGFFNFFPDSDGIVRRIPLVAELGGYIYPSMVLQALRTYLDWPNMSIEIDAGGVREIQIGDKIIRTDPSGSMLLNHYGPARTFTHVSAADVLDGRANADVLRDSIVLIGATAIGVFDYRPSPFDSTFPGVEGHAATIANILDNVEISRPVKLEFIELAAVFLISLLSGYLVHRRGPVLQSLSIFGIPLLVLLVSYWLFADYGYWVKVTYMILGVLMATLPLTLLEYIVEWRKRSFIHDAFSRYLAPKVVENLAAHPEALQLGGAERHITAMFSDIASFSSFSEDLTPHELVHFLNLYLTAMSDIILERGGTIDKYEGDAVIAFFGAPLEMDNHAVQCVLAALEQQKTLVALRHQWAKEGYPEVHIRIGINNGPIVVGNMGTRKHMNYTMMGDNVNLASRLEGVCKVYRVPILISRDTYLEVREHISCVFVDRVRVVGRATPVDIYLPLAERHEISEADLQPYRNYEKAWNLMHKRQFDQAAMILKKLLAENPAQGMIEVMLERVNSYRKSPPPPDWDTVFILDSK